MPQNCFCIRVNACNIQLCEARVADGIQWDPHALHKVAMRGCDVQ